MDWEVVVTPTFEDWFMALSESEQIDILAMIEVLAVKGPSLARPYSDSVKGSREMSNLKELRVQHAGTPYRVFYAFDPRRRAVLLCGGVKRGAKSKRFYQTMIKVAQHAFSKHLQAKDEKSIHND
jgi:hypothetical protein